MFHPNLKGTFYHLIICFFLLRFWGKAAANLVSTLSAYQAAPHRDQPKVRNWSPHIHRSNLVHYRLKCGGSDVKINTVNSQSELMLVCVCLQSEHVASVHSGLSGTFHKDSHTWNNHGKVEVSWWSHQSGLFPSFLLSTGFLLYLKIVLKYRKYFPLHCQRHASIWFEVIQL